MLSSIARHVTHARPLSSSSASSSSPGEVSAAAAGDLLAVLDNSVPQRYIPEAHVHIVSHCKVPQDKADEFWSLAQELVPHCREEPSVFAFFSIILCVFFVVLYRCRESETWLGLRWPPHAAARRCYVSRR